MWNLSLKCQPLTNDVNLRLFAVWVFACAGGIDLSIAMAANPDPQYLVTVNAADCAEGNIPKKEARLELNTADLAASPATHYSATYRFACEKAGHYAIWITGGGSGHLGRSLYSWSLDDGQFRLASNNTLITPTNISGANDRHIELAPSVALQAGEHRLTIRVENNPSPAGEHRYGFSLARVGLTQAWEPRPARLPDRMALRSGDRIFFIGDSITTGGHYIQDVAVAFASVFPQADLRFFCGDNPGDTTMQGVARLERDVLSMKPSWVVLALGINDVRDLTLYRYIRNMKDMIERSRASGARVMLLTPTVYDEDSAKQPKDATGYVAEMLNDEAVKYHNRALVAMAEEITHLAKANGGLVADVHTPFKELIESRHAGRHALDVLPDRLHPTKEGHLVMAIAILKGFGMTNDEIERSELTIPPPIRSVFGLKELPQPERK